MTRQKRFFHECQNYHESDKPFKINMHHVSLRQSVEETRLGKEKGEGKGEGKEEVILCKEVCLSTTCVHRLSYVE